MQDLELEKEFEVEEDDGLLQNNPVVVEVLDIDNQVLEATEGDGGKNGRKRKLPPMPKPKPKDKQPLTRTPAKCWQHFEKIYEGGILKWGECKYCKKRYVAETQKHGTSNMRAHIPDGCKEYPYNDQKNGQQNISFKQTDEGVEVVACVFSFDACKRALAEMIVIDELPFRFVEGIGFKRFCNLMQPKFTKVPSRTTIAGEVIAIFNNEKGKLKKLLKGRRICPLQIREHQYKTLATCVSQHTL